LPILPKPFKKPDESLLSKFDQFCIFSKLVVFWWCTMKVPAKLQEEAIIIRCTGMAILEDMTEIKPIPFLSCHPRQQCYCTYLLEKFDYVK
jgi:hypothetical protein